MSWLGLPLSVACTGSEMRGPPFPGALIQPWGLVFTLPRGHSTGTAPVLSRHVNACGPDPRHVSARTGKPGPATTPTHPTPTRLPPGYPPTGPTPDPSHPTQRRGLGGNTKKGLGGDMGVPPKPSGFGGTITLNTPNPPQEEDWVGVSGGVLLSHTLPCAVPSALRGLASGFGMRPGVSLTL